MKKIIILLSVLVGILVLLCSCDCKHENLSQATCTTASTCLDCGQTISDALGHIDGEWITNKEPNCTEDGIKHQVCSVCNEAIKTETLTKLGHVDGGWITNKASNCTEEGIRHQICGFCGETIKTEILEKLEHVEIVDPGVEATCITNGQTAGSHCSVCNEIIVAQKIVEKVSHVEVVDVAIASTCTTDGKTEGKHCGLCNTVLIEQTVIVATGHQYNNGEIITEATCVQLGVKKFTCIANDCNDSYTEEFSLPKYTANELYNKSIQYVGEIITYDKNGSKYALGTGFVISTDGKIVTNYHVIKDACSADITINGKKYIIDSVLAYDSNLDLAILKINENDLTAATVCGRAVGVGDAVYAIGSSRGMTNTYSQGIVTYSERVVDGVTCVQHDASITNGNSGGPLINEYGEVIGINTWTISNSQNLNFAVSVNELDDLTYCEPLTLKELYEKENNAFEKLKNYIIKNDKSFYDYRTDFVVELGHSYSSDGTSKYTRVAHYNSESNTITLKLLINSEYVAYFIFYSNINGVYDWGYSDSNGRRMGGTLYASSFTPSTVLDCYYDNFSNLTLKNSACKLASSMIALLCGYMELDYSDIGVTAEDLCFYYF